MSFLADLRENILIADGAMGTILYSHGVDRSFEELNMTHPEQIQHIHEAYIHAGANVIQTNTYGANFIKLARYGLEDRVGEINRRAVEIARRASANNAYVLGNIGGIYGGKLLRVTEQEIEQSFREQLFHLLEAGVDGLILETYYSLDELKSVLQIARKETDLPVVANLSMHEPGVLENGMTLATGLKQLEALGANVVGVNCRFGPAQMVTALETVPLLETAYLAAYPNASLPAYRDGVLFYEAEPAYFKTVGKEFRNQGVRLVGGCCGTSPEHIRQLAEGLKDMEPIREKRVRQAEQVTVLKTPKKVPRSLAEKAKEETTVIVELDAPKHLDMTEYNAGVRALKAVGVDAITLADNSLATPRVSNIAVATILQKYGVTPLVHLTCRDRNLIGLQSHLMGLHTLGINEILAITGDPTKIGDFPGATSVFDVNSFGLIELIKKGNEGISFAGHSLREKTVFNVAAAFNPNVANLQKAVKRMEKKIASGADYILTQPIFSKERIVELKEVTEHIEVPIFVGIMPLTSTRNAEFLHNEVPGITLTDEVRARMKTTEGDRKRATQESIAICKELIDTVLEHFNGIYLITPFMRYDICVDLVKYIHDQVKQRSLQVSNK